MREVLGYPKVWIDSAAANRSRISSDSIEGVGKMDDRLLYSAQPRKSSHTAELQGYK